MARELETDGEHNRLVVYDLGRISHALDADPTRPYISYEIVRRSQTTGGKVTKEWEEPVEIGRITDTRVLKKLKAKALYSLWGEMEMVGELETAEYVIFDPRRTEGDIRGSFEDGKR